MSDPNHFHVGWPPRDVWHILDRIKRGLPVYWPTDPKPLDQTKYIEWAAKPEGTPKQ